MITKILFAVFCLMVIGTESHGFLLRNKRSQDPVVNEWQCNQAIDSCISDIVRQYDHIWKSASPEEFIYQDGFIDGVCSEVQQVAPCLEDVLQTNNCSNDWRRALTMGANLVDLACSDKGKQVILATADSACWQDKDKGYKAIMSSRGCYGMFLFEADGTCQAVEKMQTCITTSLAPCGEFVLNLFNGAWPALMTYFPDLQRCLSESGQSN